MKKLLVILAALLVASSLIACSNDDKKQTDNSEKETLSSVPTEDSTEAPTESDTSDSGNTDISADERDFKETNDVVIAAANSGAIQLRTNTDLSSDSSKNAPSVKNGTELERTATDGTWSKVKYNGNEYYVSNAVIAEKTVIDGFMDVTAKVKMKDDKTLNVRSFPKTGEKDFSSSIICSVKGGDILEVVGYNGSIGEQGWYKIKLTKTETQPLEYGYISAYSEYSEIIEGSLETTTEAQTEEQTEAQTETQTDETTIATGDAE